jgi:hypothetical protein
MFDIVQSPKFIPDALDLACKTLGASPSAGIAPELTCSDASHTGLGRLFAKAGARVAKRSKSSVPQPVKCSNFEGALQSSSRPLRCELHIPTQPPFFEILNHLVVIGSSEIGGLDVQVPQPDWNRLTYFLVLKEGD